MFWMLVRFDSDPAEDDMLGARRLPSFIAVLRFRNPNLKFFTFAFTLHQICKHVAFKPATLVSYFQYVITLGVQCMNL